MTADSVPRQPICRFTFPEPPISLVVSSVCVALYRCVSCGIFRGTWSLGVVTRAKRRGSVARVCRLTPLCSRTTLCLLSLLHHRGRWVSLTHHAAAITHLLRRSCCCCQHALRLPLHPCPNLPCWCLPHLQACKHNTQAHQLENENSSDASSDVHVTYVIILDPVSVTLLRVTVTR